jgi:hypothetical protein
MTESLNSLVEAVRAGIQAESADESALDLLDVALDDLRPLADLNYAKDAVRWLLDHPTGLVDMKGWAYWTQRVETLRDQVKAAL